MEGVLFLLGLISSVVVALLKLVFALTFSWLACLIPLGIAIVLICLMNGIDFWD